MQIEIPLETTETTTETTTATTDGKVVTAAVEPNATEAALRNKGKPQDTPKGEETPSETVEPKTPEVPKTDTPLEIKVPDKVDFAAVAKEFAENNGSLSDKTVKLLESKGITQDIIETFIEGQKARAQVTRSELAKALGGDEVLQATLEWAATGLSPEEVQTYNTLLKSPDTAAQKVALQALKAKMDADLGTEGTRVVAEGTPGTRGIQPFGSWAEVQKEMRSTEYKTDPAYRAKVAKRLEVSRL